MNAAESGSADKIASLVDDSKADVKIANEHGLTALHFVSTPEAARALVQRGADIEAKARDSWHSAHETPLMLAIRRSNVAVIKELAALGADLDADDSAPVKRCIDHPFGQSFKKAVMAALLAAGAHVDGVSGAPPIFFAAEKRELDAVRFLCDNGANLAITVSRGGGPQETVLAMLMRLHLARTLRYPGHPPLYEAVIDELRARNAPLA
jgi:ankyrin repeat protein